MSAMDRHAAEVRAAHPYPSTDPLDRLRHTVSVYAGSDADQIAITATSGIYPIGACVAGYDWETGKTGLTHGDLRALLARLGG